ncbi:MAG: bifunctional metallophosphatase/5'-nucleotidase, partial [Lachnospiraceae bacterium]|nr:bifunctional metallophosphatase/5'-nucleotidase [Lachnospiraceae bacterium]
MAGDSFMLLDHGSGFTAFDGCKVIQDESMMDIEVLVVYLEQLKGVVGEEYSDPYGQGRIVIVEEEAAEEAA